MIWPRTILDGIVVCLIFNVTVALLWMMIPNAFSKMLPAEIRKASPKREKKEIIILESVLDGYVEMAFINFGDLIGLDGFMRGIVKKRGMMIPGMEHCEAWNLKPWMLTLALPEHCIAWPIIVGPITGLICAGIGALI